MSDSDNKEEALAIIRGIVGAATDIAKIANEMGQEGDKISVAPPASAPAPAKGTVTEPAEKIAPPPPKAEVKASSQAEVLDKLLNRKSGKV
ncbi:hypothetical protein [Magnetospirillum sp. SS-4]|jgi:hypothetical protein|uniref:hypothetical protein n=1 Tax=Magnetospirillum sp. SS-4 TaxID=2681465 RepID=UPI001571EDA9|nr:hypothetical protein [Magnetospirillum sp. SS-4]